MNVILPTRFGFAFIYLCSILQFLRANFQSIYLESPVNGGNVFLHDGDTGTVTVEYSLYGVQQQDAQEISQYEFCFEINSVTHGINSVPFSCVDTAQKRFDLANFRAGDYSITAVLKEKDRKEILEYTRIVNVFHVVSYTDTLPVITITNTPGDIVVAANVQSRTASIDLPFSITPSRFESSILEASSFAVCASVEDRTTQQILVSWTCLKPTDRVLSLNHLLCDHTYDIRLRLRNMLSPDRSARSLIASTEVAQGIAIRDVADTLPGISVSTSPREYGVEIGQLAKLQFIYNLEYPLPASLNTHSQFFVCLHLEYSQSPFPSISDPIEPSDDIQTIIDYSCVDSKNDFMTVDNMKTGFYRATLSISVDKRSVVQTPVSSLPRSESIDIEVRQMEEFVPSYEWQSLHAWSTIPSGIETRLPVGNSPTARKEARISNPWRLQLALPKPICKKSYFLRMDVIRTMSMDQILMEVARQCGPITSHKHKASSDSIKLREESADAGSIESDAETTVERGTEEARKERKEKQENDIGSAIHCFAILIQLDHTSKDGDSNITQEENLFVVRPPQQQQQQSADSQFPHHAAVKWADEWTVETVNFFNANHKEIQWIGQDHPDYCPQIEVL